MVLQQLNKERFLKVKDTVHEYEFIHEMSKSRYGFSNLGAAALFDFLSELETDSGHELEFDPIAISCDFIEYRDFDELKKDYSSIETIDQLINETTVIQFKDGIIIQSF